MLNPRIEERNTQKRRRNECLDVNPSPQTFQLSVQVFFTFDVWHIFSFGERESIRIEVRGTRANTEFGVGRQTLNTYHRQLLYDVEAFGIQ